MRACIHCGETGGTRIGGPCISCEFDDSDCDDLVAEGRVQAIEETVAAIAAWLRKMRTCDQTELDYMLTHLADGVENLDWKEKNG